MGSIGMADALEAIVYVSGFTDDVERMKLLEAFSHMSIGISTPTNLKYYDHGGLDKGGDDRKKCITTLVTALKGVTLPQVNGAAVANVVLPTAQKVNQLGEVINLCLKACDLDADRKLEKIGLSDRPETATGDVVYPAREIVILRQIANEVAGGILPDGMDPSHRLVSAFVRVIRLDPPMLRALNLGMVVTSYGAKDRCKIFQSTQEKMTSTDEYDLEVADKVEEKFEILRRIKILLHAIVIACSQVIDRANVKNYQGDKKCTTLTYQGNKSTLYCTRLLVEVVMSHILDHGGSLTAAQLIIAWEKTLCIASSKVKEYYFIIPAFKEALKETQGYWLGQWHDAPPIATPRAQQPNGEQKSKVACRDWNQGKCDKKGQCKFTHKCSSCGSSGHRNGDEKCSNKKGPKRKAEQGDRNDDRNGRNEGRNDDKERDRRMDEYQSRQRIK